MQKAFLVLLLSIALVHPAGASIFDDFEDLKGQTVVEAGKLKPLTCPIGGGYDCLTWPTAFFQLKSVCLEAVGGYVSGYSLKALLTNGSAGPSLFIYSGGLGSGDFKRYGVRIYDCPAGLY